MQTTRRWALALGSIVVLSCSRQSAPPAQPQSAHVDALEDNASEQTALLTVDLHADGTAQLTGSVVKPFAYRRRHLTAPQQVGAEGGQWLEVRQGNGAPLAVPLELGARGEGGGDVVDRWEGGTVILRAPYLGAGTRFALVQQTPKGRVVLSTWGSP
jgi:hypothetical protein